MYPNFGIPKIIDFKFGTNEKLMVLGESLLFSYTLTLKW